MAVDALPARRAALPRHDDQQRPLLPFRVANTDDGGLLHVGMAHRRVLEVDRADPFAARFDHVLGPVGDPHEAVGVEGGHVAGREPSVGVQPVAALALEVAAGRPVAAHGHVAEGPAVARRRLAVGARDLELEAELHPALPGEHGAAFFLRQRIERRRGRREGAEGRGLRHAPELVHRHAIWVGQPFDHRFGHRRAADGDPLEGIDALAAFVEVVEQHGEDGGHAEREGHAFAFDQFLEAPPVHPGAGQDHAGAREAAQIGQRPGVAVVHGGDGHDRVVRRKPHGAVLARRHGVQQGGTMTVEHALGIARGAGGVAERGGGPLVEDGPVVVSAFAREQGLVAGGAGKGGGRHVRLVRHDDVALDRRQAVGDALREFDEGEVEEQHPILGVVDDVDDLIGEQPRVHRMKHGAGPRDAVEEFQMPVSVPRQRADPVAAPDSKPAQEIGEPPGALLACAVAIAVDRALDGARDHRAVAVILRRVADQRRDHERDLLHEAVHGCPFTRSVIAPHANTSTAARRDRMAARVTDGRGGRR